MVTKVEGPGSVRGPQQMKKTTRAGGGTPSGFARHLDEAGATRAASGPAAATSLTDVSAVLGAQETDDATARAAKGRARAEDILDRLEDIRLELLAGGISRERLLHLARMVANRRPQINDPRLAEILDEIDLRAQVELAKLGPAPTGEAR